MPLYRNLSSINELVGQNVDYYLQEWKCAAKINERSIFNLKTWAFGGCGANKTMYQNFYTSNKLLIVAGSCFWDSPHTDNNQLRKSFRGDPVCLWKPRGAEAARIVCKHENCRWWNFYWEFKLSSNLEMKTVFQAKLANQCNGTLSIISEQKVFISQSLFANSAESTSGLLKALQVLDQNYGSIHITVGDPIYLTSRKCRNL